MSSEDGGYYAIKGFLFQFDKTLIEVMNNPQKTIAFENQQDINYENHVLQVKHKETQDYSPSKIRKAVDSLLDLFSTDPTKMLCLYCFFADKSPQSWKLTLPELDIVISDDAKVKHPKTIRKKFLNHFIIRFAEDYENQFRFTLGLIKSKFSLSLDEEAILHHSIFQSKLLKRCCLPQQDRHVTLQDLRDFLEETEITVFHTAYQNYYGAEKYQKLIKRKYFTFTATNIENFERLFLLECDSSDSQTDLIQIASCIARKYCRPGKSPQPYLIFRNLPDDTLKNLKRALYDQGTRFFDGTYFDGDQFREIEFTNNYLNDNTFKLKIGLEDKISLLLKRVNMREVFQFFVEQPAELTFSERHYRIQIDKTAQVINLIR